MEDSTYRHRLVEVTFVLPGFKLGAKINTLVRHELCVYVLRQRCSEGGREVKIWGGGFVQKGEFSR